MLASAQPVGESIRDEPEKQDVPDGVCEGVGVRDGVLDNVIAWLPVRDWLGDADADWLLDDVGVRDAETLAVRVCDCVVRAVSEMPRYALIEAA